MQPMRRPIARRRQAALLILQLSPGERGAVYRALKKLRAICEAGVDPAKEAGETQDAG